LAADFVGAISEIWRYPVRSLRGERLDRVAVSEAGVAGDRAFGVIDAETGQEAQVADGRAWHRLLELVAEFPDPEGLTVAELTFPDGTHRRSDDQDLPRMLSDHVARTVELRHGGPHGDGFVRAYDFAPLHLLTTATLARLAAAHPNGRFAPQRFRPNFVIATPGTSGFLEDSWVGAELAIGSELRLRVTEPCKRCVTTTVAQGDLPKDPEVLKRVVKENQSIAGVYAAVLRGGTVREDDRVEVIG
jgi:uncharacterized protein YcbX